MNLKKLTGLFLLVFLFGASCKRDNNTTSGNDNGTGVPMKTADAAKAGEESLVTSIASINYLDNGVVEYLFNDRQARYAVMPGNPAYNNILGIAREAYTKGLPVKLFSEFPGNIARLEKPTAAETEVFNERMRNNLVNPDQMRKVDISTLDTLTFNLLAYQDWKAFRLCIRTVPNYNTAKQIFDFCKQQTCTVGPTQIQPCIPFNYAVDGCFARAHKMRYIIEQKYGYCSEKVFSFGYLNVLATLSGGCCINWWYHVAPIVRVKTLRGTALYVIDPSMFTQPVSLSTWLAAQENTSCNAQADVTHYSIQPSSAYTPSYGVTPQTHTYTTDNNYALTNTGLLYYALLGTTCGN